MEVDDTYVDQPLTAEEVIRQRNAEATAKDAQEREKEAARKKSKEATTQHLIQSSLAAIGREAAAAVKRLRAKNWPRGTLQDVVISYTPIYSGWLRKRMSGHFQTKDERASWRIALDDTYTSSAWLGSDKRVYFFSEVVIDGRRYKKDYHPIDMPGNAFFIYSDERKRIELSDDEIRSRVERTIQEIRKIGLN